MRVSYVLAAAILSSSLPTAAAADPGLSAEHHAVERYMLTRNGGGLGGDLQETVIFSESRSGASVYWSVERLRTERSLRGRTSVHDWIVGQNCPALGAIMDSLPEARRSAHASDDVVSDTPLTKLVATSNGGYVTDEQSEYTGPIVDWWVSAADKLKSCWRDHMAARR